MLFSTFKSQSEYVYKAQLTISINMMPCTELARVSLLGGMEWWNGTVEWNNGME